MKFLINHKRTLLLMLVDFTAIALASLLTHFFITFLEDIDTQSIISLNTETTVGHLLILSVSTVVGMTICGVYKNIWRYAGIKDFLDCIYGSVLGCAIYYAVTLLFKEHYSDIYIIFSAAIGLVSIIVTRIVYAYICSRITNQVRGVRTRTLIVGAGAACSKVILEMKDKGSRFKPVAIVDDDFSKIGRKIHGVSVVGTTYDIPSLTEKFNIKTILFAIPSLEGETKKRILKVCSETICEVKTVPFLHDLVMSADLLGQAQNINIEDLLGRDVIKFNDFEVSELVGGKVCMVTGGGGSIGSELCRQIAKYNPKKLIIVDIYENNAYDIQQELLQNCPDINLDVRIASVRDYDKMKALFEMFKPDIVYHAAAHKHVPLMETSPEEAIKNNVLGTYNVAELANTYKVEKFVLVSTDKAVNPTNVMGATKRCCEMVVQNFAQKSDFTEFVAVRFGNVLGSNGSVIPLFEKQIASGGPVTVTHPDIIRYFMTIPEAVSLILQAGTLARGGEIFVLDMGEPVKILDLAENLIRLHGKEPYNEIEIQFTGLRPGEKLFEELLMAEEGLRNTANKKIFIGKQIEIDEEEFDKNIQNLREVAYSNKSADVVAMLREIVPTFNHVVINK